jgi:hypothetical protein
MTFCAQFRCELTDRRGLASSVDSDQEDHGRGTAQLEGAGLAIHIDDANHFFPQGLPDALRIFQLALRKAVPDTFENSPGSLNADVGGEQHFFDLFDQFLTDLSLARKEPSQFSEEAGLATAARETLPEPRHVAALCNGALRLGTRRRRRRCTPRFNRFDYGWFRVRIVLGSACRGRRWRAFCGCWCRLGACCRFLGLDCWCTVIQRLGWRGLARPWLLAKQEEGDYEPDGN